MGMILYVRTVSDATLGQLLDVPESIEDVLYKDEEIEGPVSDEGLCLDLDKSWHAIHYLLTGSVWNGIGPEAFLLTGGQTIGDVDVGYGPARGFTLAETNAIAAALGKIPASIIAARFDGPKLDAADIYPQIWDRDGQVGLDYITGNYESLRDFVAMASRKNMGMLVYIS